MAVGLAASAHQDAPAAAASHAPTSIDCTRSPITQAPWCTHHHARSTSSAANMHASCMHCLAWDGARPQGPWITRQALHAAALEVEHPLALTRVALWAALPADFVACMAEFGLQLPAHQSKGQDGNQSRESDEGEGKEGQGGGLVSWDVSVLGDVWARLGQVAAEHIQSVRKGQQVGESSTDTEDEEAEE